MTRPDVTTMDAVELYQLLTRTVALTSISSDTVIKIVRDWIAAPTFGADVFEREALICLLDGNLT
jgi:hypothetical protein